MPRYGPRNPHPLSLLRGELVWEGKYDAYGRKRESPRPSPLPAPAVAERWPAAGAGGTPEGSWVNRLYHGDNRLALFALREELAGRIQLIYIDPPFASDTDYLMRVSLGSDDGAEGPADLHVLAYRDVWGPGAGSYLQTMFERLVLMRDLLTETGCLCLHCDWRANSALRLLLDEVFGPERFLNEIVWHYYNKYSAGRHCLPRAHDTLLLYAKGPRPALNALRLPREAPRRQLVRENVGGVLKNARDASGRLRYQLVTDRKADDVWRIPQLQPASREWTGYRTQKHHDLLERVIEFATQPGDLVADFFCGAGTTLTVAERLGRRWIGCDQGSPALHVTRRRLLEARTAVGGDQGPIAAPFAVLELQAATRSHWYRHTLRGNSRRYREAVLEAFGGVPLAPGSARDGLHGEAFGGLCHVAAVGARPGAAALRTLAGRAAAFGAGTLYVLAWTFAPGTWEGLERAGDGVAVRVVPVLIPPALPSAGSCPSLPFRELPRLRARPLGGMGPSGPVLDVEVLGFAPGEVFGGHRSTPAAKEGLDLLEGWSVDFAWQGNAPFAHHWWCFRSRKGGDLPLKSDRAFPLPAGGGRHRVAVLALDFYGAATVHPLTVPSPGAGPRGAGRRGRTPRAGRAR